MPIVTKINPVGIDATIQQYQQGIYTDLKAKWGITDNDYACYGRCYKNKTKDGFVAEWFMGGNDYKDAYFDDSYKVVSFFGEADRSDSDHGNLSTVVHLVFFVNVAQLKPNALHRADAEVRADVISLVNNAAFQGVEIGMDNVLREYPGSRRSEGLKGMDMQPAHCFRINLLLKYDPLQCVGAKF